AAEFAATLGEAVPYEISGTLDKAIQHAAADAEKDATAGNIVMLSPACASFDQYKNFEIRGDSFVAQVAALDGMTMLVDSGKGG
ncbi:MAG: UDP-N-acetylmuramoyl-L-alanine--D-glutamate ligase, partial [Rhizobium oryzihabitans]